MAQWAEHLPRIWRPEFRSSKPMQSQAQHLASVIAVLWWQDASWRQRSTLLPYPPSSQSSSPGEFRTAADSKETLSQKRWKMRTNTQGCPPASTCVLWHMCTLYTHAHTSYTHITLTKFKSRTKTGGWHLRNNTFLLHVHTCTYMSCTHEYTCKNM